MRVCAVLMLGLMASLPAIANPDAPPAVEASALQEGPEGLRYSDVQRGTGEPLQAGDTAPIVIRLWTQPDAPPVRIGTLEAPLEVVVAGGTLIRGLDLGVVGMRPGAERYLQIPAALASGANTPMVAVITVLDGSGSVASAPGTPATTPSAPVTTAPTGVRQPPAAPPEVTEWRTMVNGVRTADLVVGTGPSPGKEQVAIVEYTGWVADTGVLFDSSLSRAEAFKFTFGGGQVILGWEKGVRDMKVGGTRVIYIPSYLGYGSAGAGEIPPHADLIFQVQLLDLK
ncbi:MAG: FKBP-type peptidyl-prolyl cis-trans isomerase [Myxococcota bacterium]